MFDWIASRGVFIGYKKSLCDAKFKWEKILTQSQLILLSVVSSSQSKEYQICWKCAKSVYQTSLWSWWTWLFCLKTLETRGIKLDLVLVYKLIYDFCNLIVSKLIAFSSNILTAQGNASKVKIEKINNFIHCFYSSRATKVWNELSTSVVMAFIFKNCRDQLSSEKVCKVIDKLLRSACWYLAILTL